MYMAFFIICMVHEMLCLDDGMEHVVARSCRKKVWERCAEDTKF